MKITFTIFFLLVSAILFSQKSEIYLDDDFNVITKQEFKKETGNEFDYTLRFRSDTAIVNIKVQRIKAEKISLKLLDSIKNNLVETNNQSIDSDDALFINYYPGTGSCSSYEYKNNFKIQYEKHYKKIDEIENLKQFSVYKTSKKIKGFGSKIQWQPDNNNLIEQIFFPIHYPCGGYLIINKDGNYILQRGEYSYSETLIEGIKTFANNI